MNTGGDAADHVIRLTIDGIEMTARLSGAAAKNLAVLLYTILKDYDTKKTKGKTRLVSMIKSGKPLTVFGVRQSDMACFVESAKNYGVKYCVVKDPRSQNDGMTDVIVYAEDASRIDRIVDRFDLAVVKNTMETTSNSVERTTRDAKQEAPVAFTKEAEAQTELLLDDLFGTNGNGKGKQAGDMPKESSTEEGRSKTSLSTPKADVKKPSVKDRLKAIEQIQKANRPSQTKEATKPRTMKGARE